MVGAVRDSDGVPPTTPAKKAAPAKRTARSRKPPEPKWPLVRDVVLFFGGMAGVGYETLGRDIDRPTLLLLFAAMMGLPAFFPKGDK